MPIVLIIEDELPNVQRLEKMLRVLDKNIIFLENLQTVQASIAWLKTNVQPDIIFMDIRLIDGISFEIFNHVTITAPVIFITAYDEYALKAFEVNGIDYLLKPLDADKLEKSFRKAMAVKSPENDAHVLQLVKNMLARQPIYRSRFLIAHKDRYLMIMTTDIAYFTIENRTTFLVTHDSKRFIVDQTLEVLEHELDPEFFFRITRQFIISLKSIDQIYQHFNAQLKVKLIPALNDGVIISRERSALLKKWLDQADR